MEGADAAPCFLERLSEAMLQSFYDRFGGLSKLTKGWTGVYMADGGGRMRTRTAMLEISWLPRSLEGADASFWPANVCLSIFPGLCASFCFWVRGLTLFDILMGSKTFREVLKLSNLHLWLPGCSKTVRRMIFRIGVTVDRKSAMLWLTRI